MRRKRETCHIRRRSVKRPLCGRSATWSRLSIGKQRLRAWLRPRGRLVFSVYHPVRFFQKIPDFDFSRRRKVWIHLSGCDVTVWNYYHPLPDYFGALLGSGFELLDFVEPVLDRRRRGWPADSYRIPRSIVFGARKKK